MKCLHAENSTMNRELSEKYENTSNYWKTGRLGTFYGRFLDANGLIDSLDFAEEVKMEEKHKILEARKKGFNDDNWRNFPPWSN